MSIGSSFRKQGPPGVMDDESKEDPQEDQEEDEETTIQFQEDNAEMELKKSIDKIVSIY